MINGSLAGNLGRDAELKTTPGGKTVCNFSVASEGRDKQTTWVRCAMWGARAEKVSQYLTKGTKVFVTGTLSTREYNGKTSLELDVTELELLGGGRREDRPSEPKPAQRGQQRGSGGQQRGFGDDGGSDEIPF